MGVVAAALVLVHRARLSSARQQAHAHGEAGAGGGYRDSEDEGDDSHRVSNVSVAHLDS
jgi:hypothetical protein